MNKISIGIPTLNRRKVLYDTVINLLENKIDEVIEIIIVDQTQDDEIVNENRKYFNKLSKIIKYETLSFPSVCRARNIIIKKSIAEIIYFIDDDVVLTKYTIKNHLKMYNYGVSSVIGKIYNRNDNFNYMKLTIDNPKLGTIDLFPDENRVNYDFLGFGVSCNQSYLRKVLLEVQGFDENFEGGYYEDADIIDRIRKKGYKIGFNPKAMVLHLRAPVGGLRFDKIQPIKLEIKYYSYIFYYVRNFKFNFINVKKLWIVFRAGPFLKKNFINPIQFMILIIKTPSLFFKAYNNKNKIKSILSDAEF